MVTNIRRLRGEAVSISRPRSEAVNTRTQDEVTDIRRPGNII